MSSPTPDTARSMSASDKLWAELRARPGTTSDQLAHFAGIGRSTAAKILARWVADASITRTTPTQANGRPGTATFTVAPATEAEAADTDPGPSPDSSLANDSDAAEAAVRVGDLAPGTETPSAADATTTAIVVDDDSDAAETDAPVPAKNGRLAPGGIRGMVEDYLREHQGQEFGPAKIGTELGRSSGAVANALVKLAVDGYAIQTSEKPKRYAYPAQPSDS